MQGRRRKNSRRAAAKPGTQLTEATWIPDQAETVRNDRFPSGGSCWRWPQAQARMRRLSRATRRRGRWSGCSSWPRRWSLPAPACSSTAANVAPSLWRPGCFSARCLRSMPHREWSWSGRSRMRNRSTRSACHQAARGGGADARVSLLQIPAAATALPAGTRRSWPMSTPPTPTDDVRACRSPRSSRGERRTGARPRGRPRRPGPFGGRTRTPPSDRPSEQRLAARRDAPPLGGPHHLDAPVYRQRLDDLPDKPATTQRLLRNQQDIGDAIKPFYGRAAGERLTALLPEHIMVAADATGRREGRRPGRRSSATAALWYRNANQIADFLHKANPRHWPRGRCAR